MWTVWVLFITLRIIVAHINDQIELENSATVETTMKNILGLCYSNDSTQRPIFILRGVNLIDEYLFREPPVSIILMDKLLDFGDDCKNHSLVNFKPNIVIVGGDSPEALKSDLVLLRKSQWWNYTANYFILGRNQNRCENISGILTTAWEMNIINSIYVCLTSENITELYTLNQITNYALAPWEKTDIPVKGTIYRQLFDANHSCRNLHYDKTKVLNGFRIKGALAEMSKEHHKDMNFVTRLLKTVVEKLKVRFILIKKPPGESVMEAVADGTADMTMTFGILYWNPERQFLFPYMWNEVLAARKSDDYLSTLEKIDNLWSIPTRVVGLLIFSIFFLVMVHDNRDISSAMLEIVRLLTYVSITTTRRKLSFRIFLAMMLMFMVISNGVFQGAISSFLTKPQRAKGIQTIKELIELNYTIYTPEGTTERAREECPDNEVIEVPVEICPQYLLNRSRAVCLTFRQFFYEYYTNFSLTLMKEPLKVSFFNHKCRDDWPLQRRFNDYFVQIFESGLFNYWLTEKIRIAELKERASELGLLSPTYKPVELKALDFVFQLLAIGLSLATVAFIVEIITKKCKIGL